MPQFPDSTQKRKRKRKRDNKKYTITSTDDDDGGCGCFSKLWRRRRKKGNNHESYIVRRREQPAKRLTSPNPIQSKDILLVKPESQIFDLPMMVLPDIKNASKMIKKCYWDEANIANTRFYWRKMNYLLDWTTCASSSYIGCITNICAERRLRGGQIGQFLLHHSDPHRHTLTLSYIVAIGECQHLRIINKRQGVQLEGYSNIYDKLSTLIRKLSVRSAENNEDENDMPWLRYPRTFSGEHHNDTRWYRPFTSPEEAQEELKTQLDGTFLITQDPNDDGMLLHYCHKKLITLEQGFCVIQYPEQHVGIVSIRLEANKYRLSGGVTTFETLGQLVAYYAINATPVLEVLLKVPSGAMDPYFSWAPPRQGQRVSRKEASNRLKGQPDGCFVLRVSDTAKEDWVLSYNHGGTIWHERIIKRNWGSLRRLGTRDERMAYSEYFFEKTPEIAFDSFAELLEYCRRCPLLRGRLKGASLRGRITSARTVVAPSFASPQPTNSNFTSPQHKQDPVLLSYGPVSHTQDNNATKQLKALRSLLPPARPSDAGQHHTRRNAKRGGPAGLDESSFLSDGADYAPMMNITNLSLDVSRSKVNKSTTSSVFSAGQDATWLLPLTPSMRSENSILSTAISGYINPQDAVE
eukprot:m.11488 g.11488  ORF g.11488 m.11488 type:complete len:636 (-) comp4456_c0_seq1:292-2199(-)